MDSQERLQSRLSNVSAVEPILGAMRTISLSSRMLAMNRAESTARYAEGLLAVLSQVGHALPPGGTPWDPHRQKRVLVLVLGTERGLCGSLNDLLAAHAVPIVLAHQEQGVEVRLGALGKSAEKSLRRLGRSPLWTMRMPSRGLPPYAVALQLSQQWLSDYEGGELDGVQVVHAVRRGLSGYFSTTSQLLPPDLTLQVTADDLQWPPILEGDLLSLYRRSLALWLCTSFYGIMLRSAVAEHSARYQLTEGAARNAERLTEELALQLQQARQEAITAEMQDLMGGAGLIGGRN